MDNNNKTILGRPKATITEYTKEELDALIENSKWSYCGLPCVNLAINGVKENWLIAVNEAEGDEAMEEYIMRSLSDMPAHIAEITGVDESSVNLIVKTMGERANEVLLSILNATCGFPALVKWMVECGRARGFFLALGGVEVKLPCGYLAYYR